MVIIDLSRINFGAPAAERDSALGQYFVESESFKRVEAKKKFVLLGNRGSGKSAILKVLAERERRKGALVIELAPEDYSYEILSTILAKEKEGAWAKQGAFAAAWKYLIYVLIMKGLNAKNPSYKTGPSAQIYAYLRDHHAGEQPNPIAVLISYLKRMEGLKVGKYEASVKSKELLKLYKLEEIDQLLPSIHELCKKTHVSVLIDELDRGWDGSEDAKAFVSGLFQAAVSINNPSEDLRVVISLRRELYDSIPALYEDAQKYRDVMEVVVWDEPSLLQLVAKRIKHWVPEIKDKSDLDCWNLLFAETLDYRKNKSFNYMVDRTLYRPREIIQFCSECVEEAHKVVQNPINYSVISRSELQYSNDRSKDIAAEYRFQMPGLTSIFEVFRGRSFFMPKDDLSLICIGISTGEYAVSPEAGWVLNQEPEYLIDALWNIGFLRAQAVGGIKALQRSGSTYLGPHQVNNLNLRNITRFQVHPMFRSYLGMKEPKTSVTED